MYVHSALQPMLIPFDTHSVEAKVDPVNVSELQNEVSFN